MNDQPQRPSFRSQIITTLKVFTAAGAVMLALWLLEQIWAP
jgi:hypothetical protein